MSEELTTQPRIFRKNLIDLDYNTISITATDLVATNNGQAFVNFLRNRDNTSGYATTGSDDSANTELVIDMQDVIEFNTLILVAHNFKAYTLEYWDDVLSEWATFPTPIALTTNELTTTFHQFDSIHSSKLRLIIQGTMIANKDKFLRQFIVTRKIRAGQFEGWPVFRGATIDLSKKGNETLSGKTKIIERVGGYSTDLMFKTWPIDEDLKILEEMHFLHPRGFLFWPSGGDESQFRYVRNAFRAQDIFLCGVISEWSPDWEKGVYQYGMNINVKLVEVI